MTVKRSSVRFFQALRRRSLFVATVLIAPVGVLVAVLIWVSPMLIANGMPSAPRTQTTPSSPLDGSPATTPGDAQFHLRAQSNLVVVRVVVRDSQGRPVENLNKEDFKLFDNGLEQTISQFSMETPSSALVPSSPSQPGAPPDLKKTAPPSSPVLPRVLALYFDDLNMGLDEINSARDAADSYLTKNLQPPNRAAIFTSSGSIHTDFTSDLKVLHAALSRVVPIPVIRECPQISDYQAYRIVEYDDPEAQILAASDAQLRCHMFGPSANSAPTGASGSSGAIAQGGTGQGGPTQGGSAQGGSPGGAGQGGKQGGGQQSNNQGGLSADMGSGPIGEGLAAFVKMQARFVWSQAQRRAQQSLNGLSQVEDRIAYTRGQKGIILTSAGFLSLNAQDQINRVIDRAVRAQIVISSLDPKGVAMLMPELDVSSNFDPKLISSLHAFASSNELYVTSALAEIAEGTGGDFFHHNNDLNAGFLRLGEPPISYILAFAPSNLDGKFHKLHVKLTQAKGTLQARRGYYAVKTEQNEQVNEQAMEREELRQAMASREEFRQLSVDVRTELAPSPGATKELDVLVRLDVGPIHFRREGDNNINTLTFAAGIYGSDGQWVTGQQKQVQLTLPDSQLQDMRTKGVGVKNTFQLKPGTYLLRTVVQDSEDHQLAAQNKEIQIP